MDNDVPRNLRQDWTKVRESGAAFGGEVKERVTSYIVAAFGLVAGLAWNDAIRSFIDFVIPKQSDTIVAKFIYAVIITFVVVITVYLVRLIERKKEENAHEETRESQ